MDRKDWYTVALRKDTKMEQLKKVSIEQLLEMSRQEQNEYLATLPKVEAEELAQKIFRAESDRNVQKLVGNLNSNSQTK